MGDAKKRKQAGEDLFTVLVTNDVRWAALGILREVKASGKHEQRLVTRAIKAIAFDEDYAFDIEVRLEDMNISAAMVQANDVPAQEKLKYVVKRRNLLEAHRKWQHEDTKLVLAKETITTLIEQISGADLNGRGAEKVVPWLEYLQGIKDMPVPNESQAVDGDPADLPQANNTEQDQPRAGAEAPHGRGPEPSNELSK